MPIGNAITAGMQPQTDCRRSRRRCALCNAGVDVLATRTATRSADRKNDKRRGVARPRTLPRRITSGLAAITSVLRASKNHHFAPPAPYAKRELLFTRLCPHVDSCESKPSHEECGQPGGEPVYTKERHKRKEERQARCKRHRVDRRATEKPAAATVGVNVLFSVRKRSGSPDSGNTEAAQVLTGGSAKNKLAPAGTKRSGM